MYRFSFSVQESPLSKQGNLTGTPRKIRDSAADLYNYIQTWNGHHIQGVAILSQIMEFKLDNPYVVLNFNQKNSRDINGYV